MQAPLRDQKIRQLMQENARLSGQLDSRDEELSALHQQILEITAERDKFRQTVNKSRDKISQVDVLIAKGIKSGLVKEREQYEALRNENAIFLRENKILKDEKQRFLEREQELQRRLGELEEQRVQNFRGDESLRDAWKNYETFQKKEKDHGRELEQRAKDLNAMARRLEEVEIENRFLKEMKGVPDNFGQRELLLSEFRDVETRRVNEQKRLFRYYEKEVEQLERERANLKAQLRQMAAVGQDGSRYPGLTEDQRIRVQEFIAKLRVGQDSDAALRSEFELRRENAKLQEKITLLKQEILANMDGHVRTLNKQTGIFAMSSNNEELQKQMMGVIEDNNTKLGQICALMANINTIPVAADTSGVLPSPHPSSHGLPQPGGKFVNLPATVPVGGDRFARPVEPVPRPGADPIGYSHRFSGEIGVRPFDMERDAESVKMDFAFLQTQLIEMMEHGSRKENQEKWFSEQLERIHTKLRMHVLIQDQLYTSYIGWKQNAQAETVRLREDNQQLRTKLQEAKLKVEVVDQKLEAAMSAGGERAKVVELTKQNAILEFNLQKLQQKYGQLVQEEKMLRTAYHQVEPEYAERNRELVEKLVRLQNFKREAVYNLRFLFNKLRESVSESEYHKLLHEHGTLKEKQEHAIVKETALHRKLAELEAAKRQNYLHLQKLREAEDLRMDAEAEVESLKKRLEAIDPQFHWQRSLLNRMLMVLRRFRLSPQHVFQHFDSSGDGKLSRSEFQQALKQMRIPDLTPQQFQGLLAQLDVDRDGSIRYKQFVTRLTRYGVRSRSSQEQIIFTISELVSRKGISLTSAFQIFDRDGSGVISKEEFKDALRNMQLDVSDKQLDRLVAHLMGRVEGSSSVRALGGTSGGIDYSEFARLFTRRAQELASQENERNAKGVPKSQLALLRSQVFLQVQRTLERSSQSVEQSFQRLGLGRDGRVTKQELRRYLESSGAQLADTEYDAFFRQLDYDGDGVVSTHQFIAEYHNARRQQDIQNSISATGQAQFGETNEAMRLRTQVALLEGRERNAEHRYELLHRRFADLEEQYDRQNRVMDDLEKQNLDLTEHFHTEKERVQALDRQLSGSLLKTEASAIQLEAEKTRLELDKFRSACNTYKSLYEAGANQVRLLVLAAERKKDQSQSLYNALRDMQTKSPEHRQFGKLYYIIMLQRWQEAAANRKYDEVLEDMKSYRVEVQSLEERLSIEETAYLSSEKLLQQKTEENARLFKEISQARNRFLTIEKAEEFLEIIRGLSEGKEDLELQHSSARQEMLEMQGKLDEAEMRRDRAQDLVEVLRNGTATELSNKVLEVSEQLGRMRLNELRAQRELGVAQEKEAYTSRISQKQLEAIKRLETQNSQMVAKVTRVEEEMRQRDNERQALFFEAALTTQQIKTPGFSPQVPQIFTDNTLGRTPQEVRSIRARAQQQQQSSRDGGRDMELAVARVRELEEALSMAQAQVRSKDKQLERRAQWKQADQGLFQHQDKFRELVRQQYAHLEVTHETEERNMSEAAQKIITTLRQMIANKDQVLRKKDQQLARLREDLKLQKEKDAQEIVRLSQQLTNTGQSALNQLKDAVERNKRLGVQTESAYVPEQTKILLQQQEAAIQERDRRLDEANMQLREMRERLAKLGQNIDYMSADLEHERRKNDVSLVKRELARAKRTIAEKEKELAGLGKVIGELKTQIVEHTRKLAVKEEDLNAKTLSQAAAQNAAKDSKSAVAKVEMLRNKVAQTEKKLKVAEGKVAALDADVGAMKQENENLRGRLMEQERKQKQEVKVQAKKPQAPNEMKIKQLEGKAAQAEKDAKEARTNLLLKEAELEKLRKEVEVKTKDLAATKRKAAAPSVERPTRDVGLLEKQRLETEKITTQAKQDEKRYKKAMDALNSQLQEKTKEVLKGQETIAHWREYCGKLEKEKRGFESRLAEKGKTVRSGEGQLYVSPKRAGLPVDENEDFNYADF